MPATGVADLSPASFIFEGANMSDSSVVGVLAEALAPHAFPTFDIERGCWDCPCGELVPRSSNGWEKHVASVVAALPNIAIIEVPSVGYKAVGESDAQRYLNIACRVEDGYHVGGSNSRAAVAELLRRVSDSLAARAAGGQA